MTRGGNTRKTGARYELLAAVHLEKCGYHIIEKNYRCRIGEIDLVACDGAYLVFVAVSYTHLHVVRRDGPLLPGRY